MKPTRYRTGPLAGVTCGAVQRKIPPCAGPSMASISRSRGGSSRTAPDLRTRLCRPLRWYMRNPSPAASSSGLRVNTLPRMARPTVFSDGAIGSAMARAASMMAPYCTPEGQAVWHARQSRHA